MILRLYEQFSRNDSPDGSGMCVRKNSKLLKYEHVIYHFKTLDLEKQNFKNHQAEVSELILSSKPFPQRIGITPEVLTDHFSTYLPPIYLPPYLLTPYLLTPYLLTPYLLTPYLLTPYLLIPLSTYPPIYLPPIYLPPYLQTHQNTLLNVHSLKTFASLTMRNGGSYSYIRVFTLIIVLLTFLGWGVKFSGMGKNLLDGAKIHQVDTS